ncbi:hypothetical protein KQH60_00955 [Mycetohabitans sp. B8]|uniref:hypothetical protein n=1 Tax=Mycetohabitans sp. B8 TaxID=2841845 RepID=UPI001F2BE6A7|nr:hypothetical protein [Mycetohabitans sp. B8]MCG1041210.1 hypothetical protein [Mycetohabitans sp. B8]
MPIDPSRYESEYRVFLNRLPNLSVAGQADLIANLARLLPDFHHIDDNTKSAEYYRIFQQWVQRLSQSHLGAPIGALAEVMWVVPQTQIPEYFANLRRMTLSLPTHQLGSALRYLPHVLEYLPPALQAYEFSLLAPAIQRVEPAQRTAAALGLLESTALLDNTVTKQVWQRALRLLDGADELDIMQVFQAKKILRLTWLLSPAQQEGAKIEIMAFIKRNKLTQNTIDRLHIYLARF